MTQFSVPWKPRLNSDVGQGNMRKLRIMMYAMFLLSMGGCQLAKSVFDKHPTAVFIFFVVPLLTAHGFVFVRIAIKWWAPLTRLLYRFAIFILVGAVVGSCFLVWGVHDLFEWVAVDLVAQTDPAVTTFFGGSLALDEIIPKIWGPDWLAVLIWPVQFAIVRDLIAVGALIVFFTVVPVYVIWWERKVAGRIQSRLGPMRVGGWHGWAQSPADGIKLVLKEDLVPSEADGLLFRLAPYFAIIPSAAAFLALPFGLTYVFRELDVALVFIVGTLGIEVFAVIVGGWASNNKWSVYGAMREACQMVAYEIPMGMALLVPVVCVGSLSLRTIGEAQSGGWFTWLAFSSPFAFVAFVCYFIASLASCKRAPFDLPEAESELVAGFLTEYSGFRWALFFFAEYAAMFVVCAVAVVLFLGGWNSPLPSSWGDSLGDGIFARGLRGLLFNGPIWFILKATFFIYVQIWLRWTLPRIRLDQVLYGCVQVLLPMSMLLLLGTALWVWADTSQSTIWAALTSVSNVVLGLVGIGFVAGFFVIAAYGFYHRRRLVGNLAIDPLPGG